MARKRNGIILQDFICSLLIVLLCLPITIASIKILHQNLQFEETIQDRIVSLQFRKILLLSEEISTNGNELYFTYHGRQMRASCKNHHVIIQPGTQIMFSDIDTATFESKDQIIIITYTRKGKEYHEVLAKQT